MFKLQLAQGYGFLRSRFARQAFFEHIFVPAEFFGALFMSTTWFVDWKAKGSIYRVGLVLSKKSYPQISDVKNIIQKSSFLM